jgi:hypothetical protein
MIRDSTSTQKSLDLLSTMTFKHDDDDDDDATAVQGMLLCYQPYIFYILVVTKRE